MTARGQFDLVGHSLIRYEELVIDPLVRIENWIVPPEDPQDEWTRTLMKMVGDWRAVLRSTYIRWAMAINGLHVAASKYKEEAEPKKFTVSSIRAARDGTARTEIIAEYSFKDAADAHLKIQPMLCAHGFIDIYAGLEEMIFAMYRIYWIANPDDLIKGTEFAKLRKLRRAASANEVPKAEWDNAIAARINQWQRKKLYDGLDKVFLGFCQNTSLKAPAGYISTSPDTWAESIAGVSLIRNLLMHGENVVPEDLETFCSKPHSLGFRFVAGELLRLTILDLQLLEEFCDALLRALNLSLVELARPTVRREAVARLQDDTK